MKQTVVADFVSDVDSNDISYNTYETDYAVVESAIQYWSEGQTMNPDGERIHSKEKFLLPEPNDDLWLTSNDVPIGLNSYGTLIIAEYDLHYLTRHAYALTAAEIHEIITHVQMTIDKCPDAAVWSPDVWHLFPRVERLDRFIIPF